MELDTRKLADKYVREQLAIMDGSAEAGIRRIGTTAFNKTVDDVLKTFKKIKSTKSAKTKVGQ